MPMDIIYGSGEEAIYLNLNTNTNLKIWSAFEESNGVLVP